MTRPARFVTRPGRAQVFDRQEFETRVALQRLRASSRLPNQKALWREIIRSLRRAQRHGKLDELVRDLDALVNAPTGSARRFSKDVAAGHRAAPSGVSGTRDVPEALPAPFREAPDLSCEDGRTNRGKLRLARSSKRARRSADGI